MTPTITNTDTNTTTITNTNTSTIVDDLVGNQEPPEAPETPETPETPSEGGVVIKAGLSDRTINSRLESLKSWIMSMYPEADTTMLRNIRLHAAAIADWLSAVEEFSLEETSESRREELRGHLLNYSDFLVTPILGIQTEAQKFLDPETRTVKVEWPEVKADLAAQAKRRGLRQELATNSLVFGPLGDVILQSEDGQDINLGPFEIGLPIRPEKNWDLRKPWARALKPNPMRRNSRIVHPHVQGTHICLGDPEDRQSPSNLIKSMVWAGRLFEAVELTERVLRTYNPQSPYGHLFAWYKLSCDNCGASIVEEERITCPVEGCGRVRCPSCMPTCAITGLWACNHCIGGCMCATCHRAVSLPFVRLCRETGNWHCVDCLQAAGCAVPEVASWDGPRAKAGETATRATPEVVAEWLPRLMALPRGSGVAAVSVPAWASSARSPSRPSTGWESNVSRPPAAVSDGQQCAHCAEDLTARGGLWCGWCTAWCCTTCWGQGAGLVCGTCLEASAACDRCGRRVVIGDCSICDRCGRTVCTGCYGGHGLCQICFDEAVVCDGCACVLDPEFSSYMVCDSCEVTYCDSCWDGRTCTVCGRSYCDGCWNGTRCEHCGDDYCGSCWNGTYCESCRNDYCDSCRDTGMQACSNCGYERCRACFDGEEVDGELYCEECAAARRDAEAAEAADAETPEASDEADPSGHRPTCPRCGQGCESYELDVPCPGCRECACDRCYPGDANRCLRCQARQA